MRVESDWKVWLSALTFTSKHICLAFGTNPNICFNQILFNIHRLKHLFIYSLFHFYKLSNAISIPVIIHFILNIIEYMVHMKVGFDS